MRAFLVQQRIHFLLLLLMGLWLLGYSAWSQWVTAIPLDEAISLAPKGAVTKDIRIVIPENYGLNLVFERAGVPFEKLSALLGDSKYKDGEPVPSGIRVPIRWSLRNLKGEVVASGEIESFGAISWSAAEIGRRVGYIKVEPGNYVFSAEILRDVPEFTGIKTRIAMQTDSKSSTTWHLGAVWWGAMLTILVVWPAMFIVGVQLLWRGVLTYRLQRRLRNTNP